MVDQSGTVATMGGSSGGAAATRRRAGGRPPSLLPEEGHAIREAVLSGRHTAAAMARRYRVSQATISRLLASYRATGHAAEQAANGGTVPGMERVAGVLPIAALDGRLAIVGTSGSGKTYAAKGLIEHVLAAGGRVCVVDPLGVWWGLGRAAEDNDDPPFPVVVFGGDHADVPLQLDAAAALGHLVGTHRLACVVDLSDIGTAAARRAFMTLFTAALYAANREPLHLVLDEADLWTPQRAQPDGHDLLQRVEEIVRRGRVRGFVPWLITQRPAVLHKDVLSQADVLITMRLTSSQDRDAIGGWIEGQADRAAGRRILAELPRLQQGEGWAWAPGDGVLAPARFPRIRTLDTSATPRRPLRAGPGMDAALPAPNPPALRDTLATLVEDMAREMLSPPEPRCLSTANLNALLLHLGKRLGEVRTRLAALECSVAASR